MEINQKTRFQHNRLLRLLAITASLIFLFTLAACVPKAIRESEQSADQLIKSGKFIAQNYQADGVDLHFVASCRLLMEAADESGCDVSTKFVRVIVFIHGTPGDWSVFSPQLGAGLWGRETLLIGLDRPGWGGSRLKKARVELSLKTQSDMVAPLLGALKNEYPGIEVVIVGHSLGATMVPLLAMEYPDLVDAVVSLAGDLSNDHFSVRWYNHLAALPGLSALVPTPMKKANHEVFALKANLEHMEKRWQHLSVPFLVVQGLEDGLVDPENAVFAEGLSTPGGVTVLTYPNQGHLVHLEHAEKVNRDIVTWIEATLSPN